MSSPFASVEAWETSTDTMLEVGNHVAKIVNAEGGTVQSSGNPQIELKFENNNGSIRAWESYHSEFLARIAALYDAAGLERPSAEEVDVNDKCRLSASCIDRLIGKTVGIVIREEDDNRNPGQKRRRVSGYVTPQKITESGTSSNGASTQAPASTTSGSSAADDIPF